MTKPMKTPTTEVGQPVKHPKKDHTMKPDQPHKPPSHTKLTPEDFLAGKTPNSGKLKKDGTPVPGQTPEADAKRAAERAAEAAAGGEPDDGSPDVTPGPTPAPVP